MAILTPSELQKITEEIFSDNIRKNDFGYLSDMKVENLFTVSYKSRYFLELLQNARDAIVESQGSDGKVKVWTDDNILYFANNGVDFTLDGVYSICYPAISTKTDPTMVGHKGIGFNAIREISVKPQIITRVGTFYFDIDKALVKLERKDINLPLFRYPMYDPQTINDIDSNLALEGFTTVFKFHLKNSINVNNLELKPPAAEDMIFLSAIKMLHINETIINISDFANPVVVTENGNERYFKKYRSGFTFDQTDIDSFEPDERSQFSKSGDAEAIFLLETDHKGKFQKTQRAKLHLFYGLDLLTGFSFSLHSYFSVTIERKSLMEKSSLNKLLFGHISKFYINDLVDIAKRDFPGQELEILSFTKMGNNRMDDLYNQLKIGLKTKEFIYHTRLKSYFTPSQLVLVTEYEYDVFRDGSLGDKFLYVIDSYNTFLQVEMGIPLLSDYLIKANVEQKAEQYRYDPEFFHKLYLLIEKKNLYVSDKKILLTVGGSLVAGNETDIYYQPTNKYSAPSILENDIAFLNSDINIDNLRGGLSKYLSVKEFNSAALAKRAISILKEQDISRIEDQNLVIELLHFLIQLDFTDAVLLKNLRNAVSLPVRNMKSGIVVWTKLYSQPIYFEDFKYAANYGGDFDVIDFESLRISDDLINIWHPFLLLLGAWEIPAIYLRSTPDKLHSNYLDSDVLNDPTLHKPVLIDAGFFEVIRNNWYTYSQFIIEDRGEFTMSISGAAKISSPQKFKYSSFYNQLIQMNWVPAAKRDSAKAPKLQQLYKLSEVVAISSVESGKSHNGVVYEFFPILVMDLNEYSGFCNDLDLMHLQSTAAANFSNIFGLLERLYPDPEKEVNKKGLKNLSNRLLSFLYDFLNRNNNPSNINFFKEIRFLAEGIVDQKLVWLEGKHCLHIDDKNFLDILNKNNFLDSLSNPYAFTKKDKREWGKFGSRIGRSVRNMVSTKLNSSGDVESLLKHLVHPEVIIGFIEEDLAANYTDQELLAYKEIQITVHPILNIIYLVENKEDNVSQNFYITEDKEPMLHISKSAILNPHLLALGITEWLEKYTKQELVRFHLIIERVFSLDNKETAMQYAVDQDIDEVRLQHIVSILRYNYYTEDDIIIKPSPIGVPNTSSNALPLKHLITTIKEDRFVINLEMEDSFENYFELLDDKVMTPSEAFISRTVPIESQKIDVVVPKKLMSGLQQIHSNNAELTDKAKSEIGFLAELYVYKKLNSYEPSILQLLSLGENHIGDLHWLNVHRMDNFDLPDGSRGHGHDLYFPIYDIAIEVKGMLRDTGYVTVTGKEFDSMRLRGDRYYLVIVKNMLADSFRTIVIKNPYQKILAGELMFLESKLLV